MTTLRLRATVSLILLALLVASCITAMYVAMGAAVIAGN